MVKEKTAKSKTETSTNNTGIDVDAILAQARATFSKNEKGLSLQISAGNTLSKPTEDKDFVLYPGGTESWFYQLLGIKGIPFGRIAQISGRPNSGKSSNSLNFLKSAQDAGVVCILWDTENKFSAARYDDHFGGSSRDLLVVTNKMILEGTDMILALARSVLTKYADKKIFLVWDSVGGTLATAEGDRNLRESRQMAQAAKENGLALHALVNLMEEFKNKETGEERVAVLLINQVYANIGSHGSTESGGSKLEYYSSVIVQLTRKSDFEKVRQGIKRKVGIISRAKAKKNHLMDGLDNPSELDILVTAGGISMAPVGKRKSEDGTVIDDSEDEETE